MKILITELERQDYYTIRHIADECRSVEVRAVVNGNNPGRVFVDHPTEPSALLVWMQGLEGFQIVGNEKSKSFESGLDGYMRNHIEPTLKKSGINSVEIGAETNSWDQTLQVIFNNRNMSSDIQCVFSLREGYKPIMYQSNNGAIRRIDRDVVESGRLDNQLFLEKKLLQFWDSIDSYLQKGIGYFAEYNNKAISLCFSAFVADQKHAIDVETLKEYRRKKYGTAVAKAFIHECIQKNLKPYWDCTPENSGSIQLAKTIGLLHDADYNIYWYDI